MPTTVTDFNAMIQETHSNDTAADASKRASARSSTAYLIEDEGAPSIAAHERATKKQEQTYQDIFARLPEGKPEGGKGEEDRGPLSIRLAQGRQPPGTTGQQVSQGLFATFDRHGPGKNDEGALRSMSVWADASIHHPGLVGASSMYLSHSPSKHANLEGSLLTDDKPSCQKRDFTREDHSGLKTLVVDNSYDVAMKAIKMNALEALDSIFTCRARGWNRVALVVEL